jgi:hypothetical protein
MAVLLRPFDCFSLRLEGGEKVVGLRADRLVMSLCILPFGFGINRLIK